VELEAKLAQAVHVVDKVAAPVPTLSAFQARQETEKMVVDCFKKMRSAMFAVGFDRVDVLELSLSHCIFGFGKMADQLEQLEPCCGPAWTLRGGLWRRRQRSTPSPVSRARTRTSLWMPSFRAQREGWRRAPERLSPALQSTLLVAWSGSQIASPVRMIGGDAPAVVASD
jgi:hypothetical protein